MIGLHDTSVFIEFPDCQDAIAVLSIKSVVVIEVIKLEKILGPMNIERAKVMFTVRIVVAGKLVE